MQASASAKQQSVATLLAQKNQELAAYNQKIRSAQSTANQQQGEINALYADIEEQESTIAAMEKEIKRQEEEARKKAEAEAKAKEEAARKAAIAAGKDPDSVEKVKPDYTTRTMSGGFRREDASAVLSAPVKRRPRVPAPIIRASTSRHPVARRSWRPPAVRS